MLIKNTIFTLCIFAQLVLYAADQTNQPMIDQKVVIEMSNALQSLLPKNYALVSLGLTDEELAIFDRMEIKNAANYSRFGNLELMRDEIPQYLREIGNNDEELIQKASDILNKIVMNVMNAFKKQTAWVTVRAFIPTKEYDMPRWHTDGYYYQPFTYGVQYKFAAALKGNQTLFFPMNDEMREVYKSNCNNREFLSRFFDVKQAETGQIGQGAFFIVGSPRCSALHSEPQINSTRLFISVFPGQECEIQELYERWHPKPA